VHDRVWLGEQYWANPMEDWRVAGGRTECLRGGPNRNVALLTHALTGRPAGFEMSVRLGKLGPGEGSAGFRIGIKDETDDYRAAALRGRGLSAGMTTAGQTFIGAPPDIKVKRPPLPKEVTLTLTGQTDRTEGPADARSVRRTDAIT